MHGSPPHPAGSERDEPVPGMISGGAPSPQAPPETHDPALAAGRTWSPRRETARLAAFRPLAFPAGPLAAIRPPGRHHLARGPWSGQTGPASVADQQTAHVMAVAAAPPHHRGQPSRLPKKSFRSYMLANLKAHRWPSMRGGCGRPGPAEPG
jgi:hypothetical protein